MPIRHSAGVELRTVRYVLAVADAGSVVKAAEALHMTQPAVSRQVRALERELGAELFQRGSGALRLSPAGRHLLPTLRELVASADAADSTARAIARGRLTELTFAAVSTTVTDVIAPFIATLAPDDPWPSVRTEPSEAVYAALGRGADLAIGAARPPSGMRHLAVVACPVYAYVRPDHAWAERASVAVDELVGQPVLTLPPSFQARRRLNAAWEEAGCEPSVLRTFDSAEVAMAVAASGRGVAVVSDDGRFGLRQVPITAASGRLEFTLHAAWDPGHHAGGQLRDMAQRLAAFAAGRALG